MRKRVWLRISGWMLVILGLALGLAFWLWLVPLRKSQSPGFDPGSSLVGFWENQQLVLRLGPFQHETGDYIGMFGGKEWVPRLINAFQHGHPNGCEGGHWEDAFPLLTNFALENPKDWLAWWDEHKNQSQEEWIRDGFARINVSISLPPTKDDWPKLLRILGAKSATEKFRGKPLPAFAGHLLYNATRWLRDSDFNPLSFAFENQQVVTEQEIRDGLLYYEQNRNINTAPMPGRLAFAPEDRSLWFIEGMHPTWVLSREGQWIAMSVCTGLIVLGLALCQRANNTAPRSP